MKKQSRVSRLFKTLQDVGAYDVEIKTPSDRPRRVLFKSFDRLGNVELCSSEIGFDQRKSADGYYSRYRQHCAAVAKKVFPEVLQGREPDIRIKLIY